MLQLNKIESCLEYKLLRTALAPVVQRIIDPSKHSDGMFRWVYNLTSKSELSVDG